MEISLSAGSVSQWLINTTAAQTSDSYPEVTAPKNPCQAQPDDQAQTDGNEADDQNEQANDASRPELKNCNGVLTPSKTGDQDIEEPPPDTGTTPVIPPEIVPEQPPS